jgi:hypothetical protein
MNDWSYSSYHAMISESPTQLDRNNVLDWFGNLEGFKQTHKNRPPESLFLKLDF